MSAVDVLRWSTQAAFVGLSILGVRTWLRRRTTADAWMTLTFATIGLVVVASYVVPEDPEGWFEEGQQRLLIAVLALFPYFLYRFTATFEPPRRTPTWLAPALTVALVVWTVALPDFPGPDDDRPGSFIAYLVFLLAVWSLISIIVAVQLWRAGRGEPRVAGGRMRALAFGALAMAVALIVSGTAGGGDEDDVGAALTQLLALLSAAFFFAAYAPPPILRAWWRRKEAAELRRAELELLATTRPHEVASILLPRIQDILGLRDARLVESRIRTEAAADVVVVPMRDGALVVRTSPYAPVFGEEELDLLRSLAVVADLALDRNRLLASEQRFRSDVERSNRELEQFAYAASHDLKEPLRLVAGFSNLLRSRYSEPLGEDGATLLDAIGRSVDRMEELIDDLLELSRVGRADLALERQTLSVPLAQAIENLASAISESRADIDTHDLPVANVDPGLFTLVFQNLLANAIKYHGATTPDITVSGVERNGSVEVVVTDRGEGIDPKYHDRIFNVFERIHEGDGSPRGTGIGLAIVKKIVELHGGRIGVESAPGEGSTFRVVLPA